MITFIAQCYKSNQSVSRFGRVPGKVHALLFAVAYVGGLLTIVSPCILPVLPFVFARADRPFRQSGLPLLAGMALTFAGVAALATTDDATRLDAIANDQAADVIVAGAYGHSRLREWALGGVTKDLLLEANRCSFVSH